MTENTIIDELVKNEKKKFSFFGNISEQQRVSISDRDIYKDYDRLAKPLSQTEVSEDRLFQNIRNHIVVCGIHSSILHFILPLRAKYLGDKQ